MKTAIMQPYFFPNLSYYKLIHSVDTFIFLDDVDFIKKGWINRNKIQYNGSELLINVKCQGLSQNKKINSIKLLGDKRENQKLLKTIYLAYSKSPYFSKVFKLIENCLLNDAKNLANYSSNTIIQVLNYLKVDRKIQYSSIDYPQTSKLKKEERLIKICKSLGSETYINPEGGKKIYKKERFIKDDIILKFLVSNNTPYKQFDKEFIPYLSIIDTLMFNDVESVNKLLTHYELV